MDTGYPPLVAFTVEADPPGVVGVPGAFYFVDFTDEFDIGTDASWHDLDDPPLVGFSGAADPPPVSDTDGQYNSLFYDPSFYDTTVVSWTVID